MNEPIIVERRDRQTVSIDDVEELLYSLQQTGLNAARAEEPLPVVASLDWGEVVTLWVAAKTAEATIGHVVPLVVDWLRKRFRYEPENQQRPKAVLIMLYEEGRAEGIPYEFVQLTSPDAEPVRKTSEDWDIQRAARRRGLRHKPPMIRNPIEEAVQSYAMRLLKEASWRSDRFFEGFDPYAVALEAEMDPAGPYYAAAIAYLVEELEVLQCVQESSPTASNPLYRWRDRRDRTSGRG